MSNRVLATNWNRASPAQRAQFTALFKDLLAHTYWQRISGYTNEQVRYIDSRIRDDQYATVRTLIVTDSIDIPVDYKLVRQDQTWIAYDVVIEQVSLVRNYRGNYQVIVKNEGIDGLLQQLEIDAARASAVSFE